MKRFVPSVYLIFGKPLIDHQVKGLTCLHMFSFFVFERTAVVLTVFVVCGACLYMNEPVKQVRFLVVHRERCVYSTSPAHEGHPEVALPLV